MKESFENSPVFARFREAMERAEPPARFVVALSGGLDSMLLARCLVAWGAGERPIIAAHVHHGLRGADADADAAFSRELAGELGMEYRELAADAARTALAENVGLEEAGRRIRYRFLAELAGPDGAVLAGHHADDQAETILMNLRRGAHARGLSGMRSDGRVIVPEGVSVRVIRPFLDVRKNALAEFAQANGWTWREDRTNADPGFFRNRVRTRIIPALEKMSPGLTDHLLENAAKMRAEDERQSARAMAYLTSRARHEGGGVFVPTEPELLADEDLLSYVLRGVIEGMTGAMLSGRRAIAMLSALASGGRLNETVVLTGGLHVRRERDGLFFFRIVRDVSLAGDEEGAVLPEPPFAVEKLGMAVSAEWVPAGTPMPREDIENPSVEWLNPDAIQFPLVLRPPRPGERFRVMGSPGRRKIQDLLVDLKVPRRQRGLARVLADGEGVLWVWPLRLAEKGRLPELRGPALRVHIERL